MDVDALHRPVIHLRRAVCKPPYRLDITMSSTCSQAFTGSAYGSASDTAFPSPSLKLPLKARSPRLGSDSTSLTSELRLIYARASRKIGRAQCRERVC